MDRRFPPRYAAASTKSRKTCNVIYSKYAVNFPGAFRPRMTPSGLWEYKQCYLNEGTTRPIHSGLVFSAGGETETEQINSADLALDDSPFDFGATCRMYKGSLKRNGVSFDVACKEYLVKMTYKFKRRIEKEVKCLVKLKHPNVLQHFGWDFERSMLVTELLWREVKLGNGNIEYVHNARQLLDTLEKDIPWTHRLDVVHKACAGLQYLHENGIIHCDVKAANIFTGGGTTSEYVVKIGNFGQANFDFGQFSLTQHTSFVSTRGASERNKVGTAPYTAPELIELGAERNFPSDVYSMGMVMIEFTLPQRSHPWEGEVSSSDLIFHHVQQGRRPTVIPNILNGLDDNVKEDWLSTINRCLDQDPEKRPPIATVTRVLHNMTTKGNDHLTSSSKVNELVLEGVIVENIPLNVHQGTVVESAGDIAFSLFEHGEGTERVQEELEACVRRLDGTMLASSSR